MALVSIVLVYCPRRERPSGSARCEIPALLMRMSTRLYLSCTVVKVSDMDASDLMCSTMGSTERLGRVAAAALPSYSDRQPVIM